MPFHKTITTQAAPIHTQKHTLFLLPLFLPTSHASNSSPTPLLYVCHQVLLRTGRRDSKAHLWTTPWLHAMSQQCFTNLHRPYSNTNHLYGVLSDDHNTHFQTHPSTIQCTTRCHSIHRGIIHFSIVCIYRKMPVNLIDRSINEKFFTLLSVGWLFFSPLLFTSDSFVT